MTFPSSQTAALDLRCPLLPQSLTEATEMLADTETVVPDVVISMVERDPALLAHLLRSVNSAYYGLGRTITSPARAVLLLGPVPVVGLVAGMSLSRLRGGGAPEVVATADAVVRHSLATAHLAQRLTETVDSSRRPAQSGEAYTAGLLHDFGKLVLLHNFPEATAELYSAAPSSEDASLCDREKAAFGFDHAEAGAIAAERSEFPEDLTQVIRHHHDPTAIADAEMAPGFLLRITAAASYGAASLGFPAGPLPERSAERVSPAAWLEVTERDLPTIGGPEGLRAWFHAEKSAVQAYTDAVLAPVS